MTINQANLPKHIAFIMDGNRRWATNNNLSQGEGHKKGVATIKEIIAHSRTLGIKYLTFFLFSSENWNRSQDEVGFLMNLLFSNLAKQEYGFLDESKIRLKFIGSEQKLSEGLKKRMRECEEHTKDYDEIIVCLAFNYGARQEICDALIKIIDKIKNHELEASDITEEMISSNLYAESLPDPDLLIRTSGEIRISNFLLWQIAYSELYFTDVLWPDFNRECLDAALENYAQRKRRYGS